MVVAAAPSSAPAPRPPRPGPERRLRRGWCRAGAAGALRAASGVGAAGAARPGPASAPPAREPRISLSGRPGCPVRFAGAGRGRPGPGALGRGALGAGRRWGRGSAGGPDRVNRGALPAPARVGLPRRLPRLRGPEPCGDEACRPGRWDLPGGLGCGTSGEFLPGHVCPGAVRVP